MRTLRSRLICAILALVMLAVLVGCSNSPSPGTSTPEITASQNAPSNTTAATAPPVERESKTLTTLLWDLGTATALPLGDNMWTEWVQEVFADPLNITMEWQIMPRWEETTMLNVWMASQEAADIVYTFDINLVVGYVNQGGLADLGPALDEYGVDIVDYVTPAVLEYGIFQDTQYAIPAKRPLPGIVGSSIRGDWLDALGLPVPTTTEEWYDTMIAFRDNDPGGLGELNIPCGMGMQEISFGYFNMLYSFIDPNLTDKEMATIYPFNYPGYKDGVRFINKCYNEGLISPEFALDTDCSKMWSDIQNGYVGFFSQNVLSGMERGAGTARFEIMAENVPGAYFLAADTFTNSTGQRPKLSNQPYGKFIMVPIFSKVTDEAIMFLNWSCDPDVRTILQYGAEGKDKAWYYREDGLLIQNASYDGDDRGAGLFQLVNGWDYGTHELNLTGQTATYVTDQARIAYEYSLTDIRFDPWFFPYWKQPIVSEGRYSNAIIDKYKEMFTLMFMCDPAEFETLYDKLANEFMQMYGNEVCAERLAVWESTME